MALIARDERHQQQIIAGIAGRKRGHKFEETLTDYINSLEFASIGPTVSPINNKHIYQGNPAIQLLQYIANSERLTITQVKAYWLGALATSGKGDMLLDQNGNPITGSKSDVLLQIVSDSGVKIIGVSVKTCNKITPTNDQMYFSTARAFCKLLEDNGITVSQEAKTGMSQFCGDDGFRPIDVLPSNVIATRLSDPNRFYWEELSPEAKEDWKKIFENYQDQITMLLFQKAYKNDPYPPTYLLHQTVKYDDFTNCNIAIFTMDEIVSLSKQFQGYVLSSYKIRKGTYKNDPNEHSAPRFGFIQFQRGGQKQHPTQLQFNLKAGYFKHI